MAKKKLSYKSAIEELESIVSDLEAEDVDIDVLTAQSQRASELIKFCKTRLKETESQVQEIIQDLDDSLDGSDPDSEPEDDDDLPF